MTAIIPQYGLVLLGFVSVFISGYLATRFWEVKAPIGRALFFMLVAEALAGLATLTFTLSSVIDAYGTLPDWVIISLRLVIFGALCGSSIHLARVYFRISSDGN